MSPTLAVLYCFPRSGGTLLNQCLLCHPGNAVLSEVNPAGSVIEPEIQARDWMQLLSPTETKEAGGLTYVEKINLISGKAQTAGLVLCLRDWSGINFLTGISPFAGRPSGHLEQRIYLRNEGYALRELALVRRTLPLYQSLKKHVPELAGMQRDDFIRCYRAYLNSIQKIRIIHLEEFTLRQEVSMRAICQHLGLGFAEDFPEKFHTNTHVTGNTTLPTPPESAGWKNIRSLPESPAAGSRSKPVDPKFAELDHLAGYQE